jgi:hypothetical protein
MSQVRSKNQSMSMMIYGNGLKGHFLAKGHQAVMADLDAVVQDSGLKRQNGLNQIQHCPQSA